MSSRAYLSIENLGVSFGGASEVLRGVDLTVDRGEFISVIGHSGGRDSTPSFSVSGESSWTRTLPFAIINVSLLAG